MHILVHYEARVGNGHSGIIRLVVVCDPAEYRAEHAHVYGNSEHYRVKDDVVFYNVGDMHDRFLSDVRFKRFKGVGAIVVTESDSRLLLIPADAPPHFFKLTFLPWMLQTINGYVADLDEPFYNVDDGRLVLADGTVDQTWAQVTSDASGERCYTLTAPTSRDGSSVASVAALDALFMLYALHNKHLFYYNKHYVPSLPPNQEVEGGGSSSAAADLECADVDYGQGFMLNKRTLYAADIEQLIEYLGIRPQLTRALAQVVSCSDLCYFNTVTGYEPDIAYANADDSGDLLIHEYAPANRNYELPVLPYAFQSTGAEDNAETRPAPRAKSAKTAKTDKTDKTDKTSTPPIDSCATEPVALVVAPVAQEPLDPGTTFIFYRDVTVDADSKSSVKCTDREIVLLPEFHKMGDVQCKTDMGCDIVNLIVQHDAVHIDVDAISKMRTLTCIIDSLYQAPTRSSADSTHAAHAQHTATKEFVLLHRCDSAETLASTCVDTVYTFLKTVKSLAAINRNRIGGDLVALGVKKTRKTKGNVYGLLLPDDATCSHTRLS
jgi:hypothetical protein